MFQKILGAVVGLFIGLSAGAATAATYNWNATCTLGCTGNASGILMLTDGSPFGFNISQFISWEYTSSSGTFFLDNSSPYLNAQGGVVNPQTGMSLEENGLGPNTLPLFQFAHALPGVVILSPDGQWQLLVGSYGWTCLNPGCTEWTDDVIRNVGNNGVFSEAIPLPAAFPLFATALAGMGLLGWRRKWKASA